MTPKKESSKPVEKSTGAKAPDRVEFRAVRESAEGSVLRVERLVVKQSTTDDKGRATVTVE